MQHANFRDFAHLAARLHDVCLHCCKINLCSCLVVNLWACLSRVLQGVACWKFCQQGLLSCNVVGSSMHRLCWTVGSSHRPRCCVPGQKRCLQRAGNQGRRHSASGVLKAAKAGDVEANCMRRVASPIHVGTLPGRQPRAGRITCLQWLSCAARALAPTRGL